LFPVGSLVELSSGEVAAVVSHNKVRRLKPRVLILTDHGKGLLETPCGMNLMLEPKDDKGDPVRIWRGCPRARTASTRATTFSPEAPARPLVMGLLNLSLAPRARLAQRRRRAATNDGKGARARRIHALARVFVTGENGLRSAFALLVINLRRSDRAAALMGRPWARAGASRRFGESRRRCGRRIASRGSGPNT
jgi:hypothetical protein